MLNKRCPRCEQEKPVSEFGKNKARKDGLQGICKLCDRKKNSEWQKAHPESSRARRKRFASTDKGKAYRRSYYKRRKAEGKIKPQKRDNKKHALNQMKRRAKAASNGIYQILPKELRKLSAAPCFYCGNKANTLDHIIPIAKGGQHSIGNLVAACKSCNSSKSDKFLIMYKNEQLKGQ